LTQAPPTGSFDEICVIDLDVRKTTWSRVHSSMRTLYLQLSREPDTDWTRFFNEERESRIVINRHGLWIEEGFIVFDCLLEDVDTYHLPDFRLSIAYANRKCQELVETRRAKGEVNRTDNRNEQQALDALRARIRGDEDKPLPPVAVDPDKADFDAKREEWRARFRAALASRNKESESGND
jgi:hypothetical protein